MMKILRNLFGVAVCTLFLVLAFPVKAELLSGNIEALTRNEWDHKGCVTASGYCITGGTTFYGVSFL